VRAWGRITNSQNQRVWAMSATDANGNNDIVYVTALCQVLNLGLGESPFYGQSGIPAAESVSQQVFPDHYVSLIQQAYAAFFAFLLINRRADSPDIPVYDASVITHQGVALNPSNKIPQ